MSLRDYSEDDDYYTQPFERKGVVSIWLDVAPCEEDPRVDALQDLCGVGYYRLDNQEAINLGERASIERLLRDISYSASFSANVVRQAQAMGIVSASWLLAQFDFNYDPSKVKRPISGKLVFIGAFQYATAAA
jgi:hypothetical protein